MEKFVISGQKPLSGTVAVSGSKNAALPILAASLLSESPVTLQNIPPLSDIYAMCDILQELGASISLSKDGIVNIDPSGIKNDTISYELAGKMRGSFLVAGPMLSRFGKIKISMPGGCAIGTRPIDLHLKGFALLGAQVKNNHGQIVLSAKKLTGTKIYLDFPSVGATENILCAAVLAEGETVIQNAAAEPEIVNLAHFLSCAGASISGAGSDTITIRGVSSLKAKEFRIIPDRIEAGSLLAAAVITGGNITITKVIPDDLKPVTAKLSEMGIACSVGEDFVTVVSPQKPRAVDIKTLPFPGFPTDMQAQMTALLSVSKGTGMITETIFENRFMHAGELSRMGASIKVSGRSAVIEGKKALTGTKVRATDLRAGAALVLAGLSAHGDTEISDIYHIERGYAGLDEKLRALGAEIHREPDTPPAF